MTTTLDAAADELAKYRTQRERYREWKLAEYRRQLRASEQSQSGPLPQYLIDAVRARQTIAEMRLEAAQQMVKSAESELQREFERFLRLEKEGAL